MDLNPIIRINQPGAFELAMHVRNATWSREWAYQARYGPEYQRDSSRAAAREYAEYARDYWDGYCLIMRPAS